MTKEDITRMALEASAGTFWWPFHEGVLERFAELVAAAEREACAKVCEESMGPHRARVFNEELAERAAAIRARCCDAP